MPATPTSRFPRVLASSVIRLVGAYVLLGAVAKLYDGTPAGLPPSIMTLLSDVDLTFRLVITAELMVAATALITPRLGWVLLSALLLVFLAVLGGQIAAGQASCGCFGGKVPVSPKVMFGIDLAALAAVLVVKPWSHTPSFGARLLLLALALLLAAVAPWLVFPPQDVNEMRPATGPGSRPATGSAPAVPANLGRWITLTPQQWVGKPFAETPLAKLIGLEKFAPFDREVSLVLYRSSCEHCAKYLERLANDQKQHGAPYLLVRVPDDVSKEALVKIKPDGPAELTLPEGTDWVVQVPWEIVLDKDGKVEKATFFG